MEIVFCQYSLEWIAHSSRAAMCKKLKNCGRRWDKMTGAPMGQSRDLILPLIEDANGRKLDIVHITYAVEDHIQTFHNHYRLVRLHEKNIYKTV